MFHVPAHKQTATPPAQDAITAPVTGPDFTVDNHGSILILNANTEAAREWVSNNISDEALTLGHHGTVVEPRYIGAIVEGIEAEGLEVAA
jgi:hypothetical protein